MRAPLARAAADKHRSRPVASHRAHSSTFNFALTDGHTVVVTRYCDKSPKIPPPSLYYAFLPSSELRTHLAAGCGTGPAGPAYGLRARGTRGQKVSGGTPPLSRPEVSRRGACDLTELCESGAFICASEPLTRDPSRWHLIEENSMICFSRDEAGRPQVTGGAAELYAQCEGDSFASEHGRTGEAGAGSRGSSVHGGRGSAPEGQEADAWSVAERAARAQAELEALGVPAHELIGLGKGRSLSMNDATLAGPRGRSTCGGSCAQLQVGPVAVLSSTASPRTSCTSPDGSRPPVPCGPPVAAWNSISASCSSDDLPACPPPARSHSFSSAPASPTKKHAPAAELEASRLRLPVSTHPVASSAPGSFAERDPKAPSILACAKMVRASGEGEPQLECASRVERASRAGCASQPVESSAEGAPAKGGVDAPAISPSASVRNPFARAHAARIPRGGDSRTPEAGPPAEKAQTPKQCTGAAIQAPEANRLVSVVSLGADSISHYRTAVGENDSTDGWRRRFVLTALSRSCPPSTMPKSQPPPTLDKGRSDGEEGNFEHQREASP